VELAAILHPIVTLPLLNVQLVNFMMFEQIYPSAMLVFVSLGFAYAAAAIGKKWKYAVPALLLMLLACGFIAYSDYWKGVSADRWTEVGKTDIGQPYAELSSWIREKTDANDVFVATNEDGFMMNALTGRKVVSYRRTHASPYISLHERMADQAVIVYGTDEAARSGLLSKYSVKYLLWTNRWVLNEFQFDQSGQLAGFFDPLTVPAGQEYQSYWDANGVKYMSYNFPFDPAPRKGVPTYDQLIAAPSQLSMEPLNSGIYQHFELKKTISYEGQDYFRIYGIKGAS